MNESQVIAEPLITPEQVKILVKTFLEEQGFRASFADAENAVFCRISNSKSSIIGSLVIPEFVTNTTVSQAERYIRARVLEACNAAAQEPINKHNG